MDLVLQKMISIDTHQVKLRRRRAKFNLECIRNRADFEPAFKGSHSGAVVAGHAVEGAQCENSGSGDAWPGVPGVPHEDRVVQHQGRAMPPVRYTRSFGQARHAATSAPYSCTPYYTGRDALLTHGGAVRAADARG